MESPLLDSVDLGKLLTGTVGGKDMASRPSQSKPLQIVGVFVAVLALVGYVVFDWRFGETDGVVPLAIGIICAILAVGWTLYQHL